MTDHSFESFSEFYPYYLSEHLNRTNRVLHYIGTTGAIVCYALAAVQGNAWLLLAAPLLGYGFAWFGHFRVEHNRPATFKHPFWSLMGDFVMLAGMLSGGLDKHLDRARELYGAGKTA